MESTVVSFIGSLGFPIVACIFLWKFISGTLDSFRQALQQNTAMLAQVCDRLDIWQAQAQEDKAKKQDDKAKKEAATYEQFPFS